MEEDLFQRLMAFTGDGVYRYTFDEGRVLFANQGFMDIMGLDGAPEDIIGKPLRELMVYTEKEGTIRRALEEHGEIHGFPYHFKTLGGENRWVVHDSFVTADPINNTRIVEAIIKNITSAHRVEEAISEERNLLRTLIDNLPDSIYFKDTESRFVAANAAVARLMGAPSPEDLLGKTDFDFYPRELAAKYFADDQEVVRTGQSMINHQEPVVDPGGNTWWFSTTKAPIRDRQGHIIGIVGIGRDVTIQRRIEEALREALQRFEAVIESTPLVAIQGFDRRGVIRHWNAASKALYGFAADEVLGRRLQDVLLTGAAVKEFEHTLREVWTTGKSTEPREWPVYNRKGEEHWVYSTIFPIFEHGKVVELFCMDVDITERKRTEEALRLDESRLEALLKLDQMADAPLEEISHFALEEAIRLAGSSIGYLAFTNEDESVLTMYAWSRNAMEECRIADKPLVYPVVTTGLWGEAIRQRRPVITNDYAAPSPWKKGYPEGHVKVQRHANVPIFDGDHIVLVAGVGNKPTDYDESDVRHLTLLMTGLWRLVQRKRAAEALRDSALKYRTVADNTYDWEFWTDPQGNFLYVSPSCKRITGYDASEFERDPAFLLRIVHPDDVDTVVQHTEREAKQALPGWLEFRIRLADGSERWVEHICQPVYDGDGNFLGNRGSNRDITARRRTEQALQESEEKYHTLFEVFPDAIFLETLDGAILDCNSSACDMYGYTREELLDLTVTDLVPESTADQVPEIVKTAVAKGRTQVEALGKRKTGEIFPVEAGVQILTIGGQRLALVHIQDITKRKRAEEERRKLEGQIQHAQKLESLGVLAGGIAHDFNNLLTGVLGHASLALLELSPVSPARESVQQIETIARRAADLTKQMLAYSGKGRFDVQAISLSEVVAEMTHLLEVSISKKCVLKYHFAEALPLFEGDATQIRQIIMNLIINASEAIGDKSGVITLATGVMRCDRAYFSETYLDENLPEGRYVYLEVADTGCGIAPEIRARLFEPFFTTKFTGRGLGLSALLGIVRSHRGAVKVYSEPGRGSTFKVLFPVVESLLSDTTPPPAPAKAWRGSGTVLVVDDEQIVRDLARDILEDAGLKVFIARNGQEGVDLFRKRSAEIDLVLLDLTMPQLDGREAFREMRRIRKDVRVILSSGYNEHDATEQFAGMGLVGFIHKPYRVDELRETVRKALQKEPPDAAPPPKKRTPRTRKKP